MHTHDHNIISFIQNTWNFSNVQIELLQNKGERFVYKISANEGNFVIKIANTAKSYEDMKKDLFIFNYAPNHGFSHIPKLFKTKDENDFVEYEGKFAFVMEYIDGGNPANTSENWSKIGMLTAQFHDIKDYPYIYQTDFTPASEKESFKEIAATLSFGKEYLKVAETLPDFSGCSTSLIHTDIGLHNIAQSKQGNLFFLDWDGVGIGITVLDLGFPLICQFIDLDTHKFDEENARVFYESYFNKRNLPLSEKKLIFDAALLFALMYLPYNDIDKAWKRIQFAINNKSIISRCVFN